MARTPVALVACLALLVGTAALGAPPDEPAAQGSLLVRVVASPKAEGGPAAPVAGAVVVATLEGREVGRAVSDAQGRARIGSLPAGEVTVRVEADGFVADESAAEIEASAEATLDVTLSPGVPFDGTVLDEETGKPVGGAAVTVEARGAVGGFMSAEFRPPYARATSDETGRFHVNGVPEGKVGTVEVVAGGYAAGAFSFRVLGGQVTPAPVVVRLARGGAVAGVVRDPAGKPVAGATVFVMPAASEDLRANPRRWRIYSQSGAREQAAATTSGPDGRFRVEGLPLGVEYAAMAEADGFTASEQKAGLVPAKDRLEVAADLVLRPASVLVVRLVDLAGKPVLAATVEIGSHMTASAEKDAPDEANLYRFEGLAPGEWPVSVKAPGYLPTWKTAQVEPGKTTELTVRLDPGVAIEGVVVDEDGKPVAGASVRVETVGGDEPGPGGWTTLGGREFTAGADGRFLAQGLAPKEADLTATNYAPGSPRSDTLKPVRVRPPAKDVRLVVVALGTASLRLVTPDGKPYSGRAFVMDGEKNVSSSGGPRTIEDGLIRIEHIKDGTYTISVGLGDYVDVSREFEGRRRTHVDLGTVVLDPGLDVRGRVVDPSGAPVPGARVQGSVAADGNGEFVLRHQARGRARIGAHADGFLPAEVEVDVAPNMAPAEIRLPRGALVKGVVQDADGAPVAEDVFFWRVGPDGKRLDDEEELVSPEEDGTFAARLPAGAYRIVARAAERGGTPPPLLDLTIKEGETREVVLKLPR